MKKRVVKKKKFIRKSSKKKVSKKAGVKHKHIAKKSSKKPVKRVSKKSLKQKKIVKKAVKKQARHQKKIAKRIPKNTVKKHHSKSVKKTVKNSPKKSAKKGSRFRIKRRVNVEDQRLKVQEKFVKKEILEEPRENVQEESAKGPKYNDEYKKQFDEKFIKNYYKNLFLKSYELITKRRDVFQKTVWLDLLFFFILFILFRASVIFILKDVSSEMDMFQLPFAFTVTVLIFLLGVFSYSLVKYKILSMIEALLENVRLNIERFDKFFILNCLTIGIGLLLFFGSYITSYFMRPWAVLIWTIFALVLILIHSFVNISHWLFAHDPRFRKTIRRTLMIMANGFSRYIGISSIILAVLAAYSLIVFGVGSILKIFEIDITMYKNIALGIGLVILYISLAYGRITFYFAVNKLKNEIKEQ